MQLGEATVSVLFNGVAATSVGTHVRFSAHRCFRFDDGPEDLACLAVLEAACRGHRRIAAAVDDGGRFLEYLMKHRPGVAARITCVVQPRAFGERALAVEVAGCPVVNIGELASHATAVLLADTRMFPRMQMRRMVPSALTVIDLDVIGEAATEVPARAWVPWSRDIIYPTYVPEITPQPGLDVLLIDCPARNLGLMPNGVGYVHNALKHTGVRFQTLDMDIIVYHRFHVRRLFDEGGTITLPNGRVLPSDPWQAEHYDFWTEPDTLAFMASDIAEIVARIVEARPKILAMSIQSCNERFSTQVVQGVRAAIPEITVVVGGFSCYNPDIGLHAFPLADYMCVGEADLTAGDLLQRLSDGERPCNIPGVVSRFDDPAVPFIPAPMQHDLDLLDHPHYEWYPLDVYRNYNGYQLTPVIASRGCRWSRCTFCAERFYWRIRSAEAFVDELEWLIEQGCHLFMFNESDLNGMPEKVLEICDEIIRRGLKAKLTGQLRIHKKSDRAFFQKLRAAGFVALRFGVDAFSENTLRLQKKGYTKATVRQNLRDCWEAGIFTEVNWVIGVPGETEADVDEGIDLILENKKYIGRLANINPLILVNGGVYWLEPDKHNIVFREDKASLYAKFPRALPAHTWYSTEPYIDELVRKAWFERIIVALHEGGFDIGPWAERVIDDVKTARDQMRAGARAAAAVRAEQSAGVAAGAEAAEPGSEAGAAPAAAEPVAAAEAAPDATAGVEPHRLSDGVGPMSPDESVGSSLEFNPDARSGSYVFRAGSVLPDDRIAAVESRVALIRRDDELFAVDPAWLTETFGADAIDADGGGTTLVASPSLRVTRAVGMNAVAELLQSVGVYNVVRFDGFIYALPQALGAVEWGVAELSNRSDVFIGRTLKEVVQKAEKAQGIAPRTPGRTPPAPRSAKKPAVIQLTVTPPVGAQPRLVSSIDAYNVVEYEGWFYGVPHALGPIDLATTDVIEMEGVIRDVSRDVVEGEIRELRARPAEAVAPA
jgi:radical SAM superfamily enzyme YgiQ (UPF0313 family)